MKVQTLCHIVDLTRDFKLISFFFKEKVPNQKESIIEYLTEIVDTSTETLYCD